MKKPHLEEVNRLHWRGEGDRLSLRVPTGRGGGQRDGRWRGKSERKGRVGLQVGWG